MDNYLLILWGCVDPELFPVQNREEALLLYCQKTSWDHDHAACYLSRGLAEDRMHCESFMAEEVEDMREELDNEQDDPA